ncbi:hypothetical protein VC159_04995 [Polynucleobacter sp. JS-JIR-II-c23]|uniref:hypothetical protein n=1 Tax=Polynucleobacter sp. JS-JIR-II-c23 TaxID=1758393 RepID=UPI002B23089E|nr:hypothetical protein [Polynucleobacter sp. JS-JIR-II-c23]MEA9603808.1 hypothetical protein [Polynucleobacter sp. JS-JIR-II-c23]
MTNTQLTFSKTKDKVISTYKKVEEKLGLLFIVVVIIPTLCSIIYFGFWASDVYISESQFVIRTAQNPINPSVSDYPIAGSLSANAVAQDSAAVAEYMLSMDAMMFVNQKIDLKKLFTSGDIDVFNRFASMHLNSGYERLLVYFRKQIAVDINPINYLSTLQVKTYSAKSAQEVNRLLLEGGEAMINKINERTRNDLMANADKVIQESRNNLQKINSQLSQLKINSVNSDQKNYVANYLDLAIQKDTAERQLAVALDALTQAISDAQRKTIYLERTVTPNLPDYPLEPKRLLGILASLLLSLMVYGVTKVILASVKEHHD